MLEILYICDMKRILTLSLVLLGLSAYAQTFEESMRFWDEGPLTWEDLTFKSPRDFRTCNLSFRWMVDSKKERVSWNTVEIKSVPRVAMDKSISWHNEDRQYPITLKYDQTLFDLNELYFRKCLTDWKNRKSAGQSTDGLSSFYDGQLNAAWKEIVDETQDGLDSTMVEQYSAKVADELAAVSYPDLTYQPDGMTFFLSIGAATGIMGGSAAETFGPTYGIDMDYSFGYNRHNGILLLSYTAGKSKKNFTYKEVTLHNGDSFNHMYVGVFYGYNLYDGSTFLVMPLAGLGLRGLTWEEKVGDDKLNGDLTCPVVLAGLGSRLKLSRTLGDNMLSESSLAVRAFAARDFGVLDTWSFNIALHFNFGGK